MALLYSTLFNSRIFNVYVPPGGPTCPVKQPAIRLRTGCPDTQPEQNPSGCLTGDSNANCLKKARDYGAARIVTGERYVPRVLLPALRCNYASYIFTRNVWEMNRAKIRQCKHDSQMELA